MAETKESLCCDTEEIHEELLKIVDETMPDETELDSLAELFKVFGDPTRIRILFVLFETETGVEISCCLYFLQQQKIQKRGCETTACKKKDQGFAKNPGSFFVCRESRTFHTDFSVDV